MQISISVLSTTGGHGDGYMPAGVDMPVIVPYPGNPSGIAGGGEEGGKKVGEILRAANLRRLADPATWPEQARYAAAGDWDGLKQFQATLKGGRRVE